MSRDPRRSAFTLIEVLIVVIIMAVLAATIIPQFSSSTNDAKSSALTFNLHTIRSQIEMYKVHHGALPTTDFVNQMTKLTNVAGATTGTAAAPLLYGPYIQGQMPVNPLNSLNTVTTVTSATDPTTGDNSTGWQYNTTTGKFLPNLLVTVWDYTNDKPL